ncbi:MAG: hypothetical protein ACT4N4_14415 [Rhodospirillales bacterium]
MTVAAHSSWHGGLPPTGLFPTQSHPPAAMTPDAAAAMGTPIGTAINANATSRAITARIAASNAIPVG